MPSPTSPPSASPSAILDYASPSLKRKLRLPSRSILTFHVGASQLTVTESLQAKAGAVAGLCFAAFILLWLAFLILTVPHVLKPLGIFWLIEFSLTLAVIHDTWRQTRLSVSPTAGLSLEFRSPFHRRPHHWPADAIQHARAHATDLTRSPTLGLLSIPLYDGPTLQLFQGHELDQLTWLAAEINRVLTPPNPSVPEPPEIP